MSKTVPIPGGTAELFEPKELTPRRRIPARAIIRRSDQLLSKVAAAERIESPSGEVEENPGLTGPAVRLTQYEAETLDHLQYATTWGYLKSWSLDMPLPATWEDILDVPSDIVETLNNEVAKLGNPDIADDFEMTAETLENKESFTGEHGSSKTQSVGTAKRRKSTPKTSNS